MAGRSFINLKIKWSICERHLRINYYYRSALQLPRMGIFRYDRTHDHWELSHPRDHLKSG